MKTLLTIAMLCGSFWAGTHFVIVPRLDAAVTPAHSAHHGAVAKAKPAKPAPKPAATFDLGF